LSEQGYDASRFTERNADLQVWMQLEAFIQEQGAPAEVEALLAHRPLATWRVFLVDPVKEDRLECRLGPAGEAVQVQRTLPEAFAGPTILPDSARGIAERYLMQKLGVAWDGYRLVDEQSVQHPARTDHHFTWQRVEPGPCGARL